MAAMRAVRAVLFWASAPRLVELGAYPRPWAVEGESDAWLVDAAGNGICEIERSGFGYEDARRYPAKRELAEFIAAAVNAAAVRPHGRR